MDIAAVDGPPYPESVESTGLVLTTDNGNMIPKTYSTGKMGKLYTVDSSV